MEDIASLLEKVVCSNCQRYLSYFPIHSDVNQNSICGRCQQFDIQNFYHNEIYEKSMEAFEFPCSYSKNGCMKSCLPKDIPMHEDGCEFRKIQCPALNDSTVEVCDWNGVTSDIYEHFEEQHPQYILQDGKFEADFVSNYKRVYLFAFGQYYFIVTKTSDGIKNVGTVNVAYTGNDPDVKKYNFKITYKNASGAKSIDVVGKIGETVQINGEIILDLLGDPLSIIAEITLYKETNTENVEGTRKENNPAVNYEMIECMKCLQCFKYMLPPIYQCETGHGVCSDCIKQIKTCPSCRGKFNSTQNFALAQVINYMVYPCTYENCNFSTRARDIRNHEATCPYRPRNCPLEDIVFCDVQPIASEMYEHLLQQHADFVLSKNKISVTSDNSNGMLLSYLIPYNNKIFLLSQTTDEYLNDFFIMWNVQYLNFDSEIKNYKFEIDIEDKSGNNRRMYLKGICTLYTENIASYDSNVYLTDLQLRKYNNYKDLLTYRVRIIEENRL